MENSSEKPNINFITSEKITLNPEIISAEIAIKKLEAEGHQVSDYAKDMLTKIDWKEAPKNSYEIVSISVEELFKDKEMHSYLDIKTRAQRYGLDLVPASLAPGIRLSYAKDGVWTAIAMDTIRDYDKTPSLFYCAARGPESWLRNFDGRDGELWHDHNQFFFVRK